MGVEISISYFLCNMIDTEFTFQGLDAKIELRFALLLIVPTILIMLGTLYLSHLFFPKTFFLNPLLFSAIISVAGATVFLRWMINRIKNQEKKWKINIKPQGNIEISYRNSFYKFNLKDILMIKNMGNIGIRYLTIKTVNNVVKIRVGNSGFAPFSTEKDVEILDGFVNYMKPYIDENFNMKVLKNALNPNIIPNFGVFVKKGMEIRYSLINKMTPWQVIVLILSLGTAFIVLFILIMEHYFR